MFQCVAESISYNGHQSITTLASNLPYLDRNPRIHSSSASTAIHMDPDPDPDVLVNTMSIGLYDISHQVATRLPIIYVVLPHILHQTSVQL